MPVVKIKKQKAKKKFIENNRLILQTQQRFKTEIHNAFTEEINKIALSLNDDKRMQSIDSIKHMHMELPMM